uniref:Uncharacterized protein n=1 Tax=Clastoptera arizonana TaxID=38151 RepID=A0A1B6E566_9HEMI
MTALTMLWFILSLLLDYPIVVILGIIMVWILLRQDAAETLRQKMASPPRVPQEDTPASAALAERLGRLESASQGWKKRVVQSDAVQFSVAGRMALAPSPTPVSPIHSPAAERKKRMPKPNRFRDKEGKTTKEIQSMPTSPEAENAPISFKRSISAPGGEEDSSLSPSECEDAVGSLVSVPRVYDEDFSNFFSSASSLMTQAQHISIKDEDLDEIKTETNHLLVQRKTVRVHHRRGASSNPIKALAARTDLRTEYVEIKSGIAQKELRRINVEKCM